MLEKLFGRNIKRIRNKKGIHQEKLAEDIGISINHLSSIELGKSNPSVQLLDRIVHELDMLPKELVMDDELVSSNKNLTLKLTLAEIYENTPSKYHDRIIGLNKELARMINDIESERK